MKTTPCAQCPWRKANQGRPPYKTLAETWRTTAETCEKAVNVIAAQRDALAAGADGLLRRMGR